MAQEVAEPASLVLAEIVDPTGAISRQGLATFAMERIKVDHFSKEVPRFLTELPFGGDDDEITDAIAARILTAADPDQAQANTGTIAGKELVGKGLTVYDLRVNEGDLEGGWGVYLMLDCTIDDSEDHVMVNTGSKDIVVRLARAWAEGALPISGAICEKPGTGKRGNAALAFIVEPPF
jgi:hypothetical protein